MNDIVYFKGKLKLILKTNNDDLFDYTCREIVLNHTICNLDNYSENWPTILQYELNTKYLIIAGKSNKAIYEIVKKEILITPSSEEELFLVRELTREPDMYEFEVHYYSKYMGFSEAIEKSFNVLKNSRNIRTVNEIKSSNLIRFISALFKH